MIVVDASALLEVLLRTATGRRLEPRLFASRESLHAPQLLDLEVVQVLRRYCRVGEMTSARAREAVHDLEDFPITRYPHTVLLPRIWELRHHHTAYDAAYLSLAEALSAPLVTRDTRLVSTQDHRVRIEIA